MEKAKRKCRIIKIDPDALYDSDAAAEVTGYSRKTFETYRVQGGGPVYFKQGRLVTYKGSDLLAWITSQRFESTAQDKKVRRPKDGEPAAEAA